MWPCGKSCSPQILVRGWSFRLGSRLVPAALCSWSEQRMIEAQAPEHLRNIVRIITETGLRIYKELIPMKKEQLDLTNATVWIPDSKTPNGVAEVPLTPLAVEAFRDQIRLSPCSPYLFPSDQNPKDTKRVEDRLAKVPSDERRFLTFGLRSSLNLRHPAQRRRRRGRVGHANASPGRRASLQEILADEIADEARSSGEAESPR